MGVTAGHIDPVTQAVNLPAQKVLIAFVYLCVFLFFVSVLLFLVANASFFRYIAFYAISWGPVVWVITGEIFVSPSHHIYSFIYSKQFIYFYDY